MALEQLFAKIAKDAPDFDRGLIVRAWDKANSAHAGQVRESGEPYISHPLAVAEILADIEQDMETVVAGLLHDVVEDTDTTLEDIEAAFGSEIALLVDGVTKLMRLRFYSKAQQQAENLRKMFMSMASDFRVILIKFADRLHNMRTLDYLPATRQREMARETLEIYAPLAHRLGIFRFKWELEDLSFRYLHPEYYSPVAESAAAEQREEIMHKIIEYLKPAWRSRIRPILPDGQSTCTAFGKDDQAARAEETASLIAIGRWSHRQGLLCGAGPGSQPV